MKSLIRLALLGTVIFVHGCGSIRSARSVADSAALVEYLRSEGVVLYATGQTTHHFFSPPGQSFNVGAGGTLQVFEYPSETSASLDAQQIDMNAMRLPIRPHFYRRGILIVLYLGDDQMILQSLSEVLSPHLLR
jgi:hypothetical protein